MNTHSWLADQVTLSPSRALSILRPKGRVLNSTLVTSLMLTSLVDAFSILVIFLLMNTSNSYQEFEIKSLNGLPNATNSDRLKKGVVLNIENGTYRINGNVIGMNQLTEALRTEKAKLEQGQLIKKVDLIIQATKAIDYNLLSPILVAASEAQFQNYKLAVIESTR